MIIGELEYLEDIWESDRITGGGGGSILVSVGVDGHPIIKTGGDYKLGKFKIKKIKDQFGQVYGVHVSSSMSSVA